MNINLRQAMSFKYRKQENVNELKPAEIEEEEEETMKEMESLIDCDDSMSSVRSQDVHTPLQKHESGSTNK